MIAKVQKQLSNDELDNILGGHLILLHDDGQISIEQFNRWIHKIEQREIEVKTHWGWLEGVMCIIIMLTSYFFGKFGP